MHEPYFLTSFTNLEVITLPVRQTWTRNFWWYDFLYL